jgi:hypothetical protein
MSTDYHALPIRDKEDDKERLISSQKSSSSMQHQMWNLDYCGLYAQYAAVGLIYGSMNISYNLCVYSYDGPSNLCANAKNIQMLAWRFDLLSGFQFPSSFLC